MLRANIASNTVKGVSHMKTLQVKELGLLLFLLTSLLMPAGIASAADALVLEESQPATSYYTTNGADPNVTPPSEPVTYTNYYTAEGTKITPPTAASFTETPLGASETISLVPGAGKGKPYVKPEKLKIHESKYEFEKHVKQKHGKRFKVEEFRVEQTESGLDSYMYIVENRDPSVLQLGDTCTNAERAHRIGVAKNFILNNSELIGLTENEELRERGRERTYCRSLYFDVYVNNYELSSAQIIITFVPQHNYSMSFQLKPVTPEMYAAAQQEALPPEEIAKIVYSDQNISIDDKNGNKPPELIMRKYLRNREPYAIWEVRDRYLYEINAVTGEIAFKQLNIKY
jgi:hypothetical protein